MPKAREKAEFGDFQTPEELALRACELLLTEERPAVVLEPTCGRGNFLLSASKVFGDARQILGFEINPEYVEEARQRLSADVRARIEIGNFFELDWKARLAPLETPILIIGNPPWVTNAELGSLGSANRPERTNFLGFSGFDALTGKSNFDVSEWMLIKLADALNGKRGQLAMLVKTAVARKLCHYVWSRAYQVQRTALFSINAMRWFDASVDACFLVMDFAAGAASVVAEIYPELSWDAQCKRIGFRAGEVVADLDCYERTRHLSGQKPASPWRSGLKHDCSSVMEFRMESGALVNGLGEKVDLESDYVFPLMKTSDVARGGWKEPRFVLVTQRKVGEDTSPIAKLAPKTWRYLEAHSPLLDKRGSSIYRGKAKFSIFGIGDYSFTPWKIAISGLYKRLSFCAVGPIDGKPVMVDDASYFLPASTEDEARELCALLNSRDAKDFFSAHIFWDSKRPITAGLLNRLNIGAFQSREVEAMPFGLVST